MITPRRPSWTFIAALLITVYGGLLRLDAFTGRYGPLSHPAWARVATRQLAPLVRHLRPSAVAWERVTRPYVGGDPIAYLGYARGMTSFYQPHVREPVFLATTRLALWSLGDQDAGVSLASAAGSVLAIVATCLLGAALISPAGGVAAAALMAIEYDNITWAVDGWRDDTFTAVFLLSALGLLRFRDRPSFGHALLVGFTAGAACLTRITALLFVLPALAWIVVTHDTGRRACLEHAATALVLLAALVAPYLISCALATGDPFFSINAHTTYYRSAEHLPIDHAMSAAEYVRLKFVRHPLETFDIGFTGLLVRPFATKWRPFDIWLAGLATAAAWAALAGLALWSCSARGRLMLVILLGSLLPYAFTWNVGAGGEWRFTMHVYPLFILAAIQTARAALRLWRFRPTLRFLIPRLTAVACVAAGGTVAYLCLPWFVIKETIAAGEPVSIGPGDRDRVFYRRGWSAPRQEGAAVVRVSQTARATVHLPLPVRRSYDLVLRFDPVAPEVQQTATVLLNHQTVGRLRLSWDPRRMGSYRVSLPAEWVRTGDNEITVIPERMVAAGSAGERFAWLDPGLQVGVRLWYVRVLN